MRTVRRWFRWHSVTMHIASPIWLALPEWLRWSIVRRLDRSRHRCWADLVSDALAQPEDDPCDVSVPTLRAPGTRCASECGWLHEHAADCGCYCGKFRFSADGDGRRA